MNSKFYLEKITSRTEKSNLPFDPLVRIVLKFKAESRESFPLVSGTLASADEVDVAIADLKLQLDAIAKEAKAVLKSERTKLQAQIGRKNQPSS
jgi:hypothetical protein